MTGSSLTIANTSGPTIHWSQDQVRVLRTELFPDLNDTQLALFAQVCKRMDLDPFAKQIYAIIRGGKLTIQCGIDAYRLSAQRTGRYNGQTEPSWFDGAAWHEVWLGNEPPKAAKIGVYIKGADHPTYGVVAWAEYAPKDLSKSNAAMWKKMPALMLVKCAEALALRKAFPAELGGVYTTEEMQQADTTPAPAAEPISAEQHKQLVDTLKAGGMPESAAKAKADSCTAPVFDAWLARAQQLVAEKAQAEAEQQQTIDVDAEEPCETCLGTGEDDGKTCPSCHGAGIAA